MFICVSLENRHSTNVFLNKEVDAWESHDWLLEDMKATYLHMESPRLRMRLRLTWAWKKWPNREELHTRRYIQINRSVYTYNVYIYIYSIHIYIIYIFIYIHSSILVYIYGVAVCEWCTDTKKVHYRRAVGPPGSKNPIRTRCLNKRRSHSLGFGHSLATWAGLDLLGLGHLKIMWSKQS